MARKGAEIWNAHANATERSSSTARALAFASIGALWAVGPQELSLVGYCSLAVLVGFFGLDLWQNLIQEKTLDEAMTAAEEMARAEGLDPLEVDYIVTSTLTAPALKFFRLKLKLLGAGLVLFAIQFGEVILSAARAR